MAREVALDRSDGSDGAVGAGCIAIYAGLSRYCGAPLPRGNAKRRQMSAMATR